MTFTSLTTAVALIILLIIPQIMKRVVYKKLTGCPSERDYRRFEKLLDEFACMLSFEPYNREYMWLSSCFIQGDKRKIEAQLDTIFSKMKMRNQQETAAARRGSCFYMENQKFKKVGDILHIYRRADKNTVELHAMEMIYSILALKESEYIGEIKEQLELVEKMSDALTNDAERVRIGISEYLLGLQYMYLYNKKLSRTYLTSALRGCRNTPCKYGIKKLLET